MLCLVAQSCPTLCDPTNCSLPGSSVHGIFQASGLPFPSQGDLPDPGIELGSPALQADSLPTELSGKVMKPLSTELSGKIMKPLLKAQKKGVQRASR